MLLPIRQNIASDSTDNIIIIGAGVCGLMAANSLQYMGVKNFVVLEASDRIGGRLKMTEKFADVPPLDVGAEWIHKKNGQITRDMLLYYDEKDEKELDDSEFIQYKPQFYFKQKRHRIISWLYSETKWKQSTWWHWLDKYVYRHVQDKVKFNAPVQEIRQLDGNDRNKAVQVTTTSGDVFSASRVICTVPLAVLQSGSIIFEPPLSASKKKAIDTVKMPPGLRVFFEMKEKFYPDLTVNNTLWGQILDVDDVCVVYDAVLGKELANENSGTGKNILGFVAVGEKSAGELSQLANEEDLIQAVLSIIDELFDGKGSEYYVKGSHVVQNWTSEPYIRGAYSFSGPSNFRHQLGKTERNILFAGEHTSPAEHSLVHGAAKEGRRAAIEAMQNHFA